MRLHKKLVFLCISSLVLIGVWFQSSTQTIGDVTSLDLSTDEMIYATGHSDGIVQIWDAESGELKLTTQAPEFSWMGPDAEFEVSDIAFRPDNQRLAVSFRNRHQLGLIRILDVTSGRTVLEYTAGDVPMSLDWDPTGHYLAVLSAVGTGMSSVSWLSIFDELGNEISHQLTRGETSMFVDWSPDGSQIAQVNGMVIILWNTEDWTYTLLEGHKQIVTEAKWSFDGSKLASVDKNTLRIWDTDSQKEQTVFHKDVTNGVSYVAWKPDGTNVASSSDNSIQVWNLETEQIVSSVKVRYINDVTWWGENGLLFASGEVRSITVAPIDTLKSKDD
jgi:WD40 repeat protein